jgi:hypothetical protein
MFSPIRQNRRDVPPIMAIPLPELLSRLLHLAIGRQVRHARNYGFRALSILV